MVGVKSGEKRPVVEIVEKFQTGTLPEYLPEDL